LRAAWRKIIRAKNPTDLVFVDECSSNTWLAPLYGWARCGERVHQKAPRNWGKNITLISSIGKEWGMGASLVVEGSTNRTVFETYLEDVLCPTLQEGQVVVMDNLSAHKAQRVRELIEGRECELVYLPPYSPDFNPIESKPSPSSRATSGWRALVANRCSWRLSARLCELSVLRMRRASSSTAATERWFNLYDRRFRGCG
jgi:transposase